MQSNHMGRSIPATTYVVRHIPIADHLSHQMVNEACQIVFIMKTVLGEEGKHFFKTRTTKYKMPQLWTRDERETMLTRHGRKRLFVG